MNEATPITYRDVVALPDDTTLQNAAEITDELRGHGTATLHAEEGTIGFEFTSGDLWDACETAHHIARTLEERAIAYDVTRDCIVLEHGQTQVEAALEASASQA